MATNLNIGRKRVRTNIQEQELTIGIYAVCGHEVKVTLRQTDKPPKLGVLCSECGKTYTVDWKGWPRSIYGN